MEDVLKGNLTELIEKIETEAQTALVAEQLVSLEAWPMLRSMLDPDWRRRPTLQECLESKMLQGAKLQQE